jgi:hypothetical protein
MRSSYPNVALEGEPGEVLLERAPVDEIGARARTEGDAGDRRLALAGRAVARARRQVDGSGRDRLGERVVLLLLTVALGLIGLLLDGVGVLVLLGAPERVRALGNDVDLKVCSGDGRLLARCLLLLVLLGGGGRRLSRGGGLLGLRGCGCGLGGGRRLGGLLGRLGALGLGLHVLLVCHQPLISRDCGFCATCGCSGPA